MSGDERISRRAMLRGTFLADLLGRARDRAADAGARDPGGDAVRYPRSAAELPATGQGARPTIPVLRPPGAVEETAFLRDCTRCDACLEACPPNAIVHAPARMRHAAGTPMIDPAVQPCVMCDDLPCVAACEPGVLSAHVPPVLGTARIVEETCLAHQGSFCTVCSERCPVDGAITLDGRHRPTVVEDTCTGCGVCFHVCPAPDNAVLVMPLLTRPPAPRSPERDA